MFNLFGQHRLFTPITSPRPLPGQAASGNNPSSGSSYGAQIKPDFIQSSVSGNSQLGFTRPSRTKQDDFTQMTPQSQRAALLDQTRNHMNQLNQARYQRPGTHIGALPGGLSERQRLEFNMLKRTDPVAAKEQLHHYLHHADIRYNKPGTTNPQPPAGSGLTYHRPPSNPTGPRRSFGN